MNIYRPPTNHIFFPVKICSSTVRIMRTSKVRWIWLPGFVYYRGFRGCVNMSPWKKRNRPDQLMRPIQSARSRTTDTRLKRFMSVFCKRRGADGSFLIPHLMHFCILTFHLFWVNTPLCQGRAALLCSKIARQISHENEWFENFFLHFCDSFLNRHIFYY